MQQADDGEKRRLRCLRRAVHEQQTRRENGHHQQRGETAEPASNHRKSEENRKYFDSYFTSPKPLPSDEVYVSVRKASKLKKKRVCKQALHASSLTGKTCATRHHSVTPIRLATESMVAGRPSIRPRWTR